jgi:hypothetical protein
MPSGYTGGGKVTAARCEYVSSGNPIFSGYVYSTPNSNSAYYRPCYWIGTTPTICAVPSDATGGDALNLLYDSAGNVICCGYVTKHSQNLPCYWKNGTYYSLSDYPGQAQSVVVIGDDVYLTGNIWVSGNETDACYWKNGALTILPVGSATWGTAGGVTINGDDVYIVGFTTLNGVNIPCYWKNGTRTDLTYGTATGGSQTCGIFVYNGVVYVCGYTHSMDWSTMTPCYWQDGTFVSLSIPANLSATGGGAWWLSYDGATIYARGSWWDSKGGNEECYWSLDGTYYGTTYYLTNATGGGSINVSIQ